METNTNLKQTQYLDLFPPVIDTILTNLYPSLPAIDVTVRQDQIQLAYSWM